MIKIDKEIINLIDDCEKDCIDEFKKIEDIAFYNQLKVLNAFNQYSVTPMHFIGSSGYGDDDVGKNKIKDLYSCVFNTEDAIVSPYLASGTASISHVLLSLLRPNDNMLSIVGRLYDTLDKVLFGVKGKDIGSLKDYNISYEEVDLLSNQYFDLDSIKKRLKEKFFKVVYIQRSRGYSFRNAINIDQIEEVCKIIKSISPKSIIVVDNCYGAFTEKKEPTDVGADIIIGSMIKNLGAGIVPTGGYIAGKKDLIELINCRLTSPALGSSVGSYEMGYKAYFQALFLSPHIVSQARKTQTVASSVMTKLGYECKPAKKDLSSDIVLSIKFNDEKKLIEFCKAFQYSSPIDSDVELEPSPMAGYSDKIIMASGSFNQGSSIELSCDAPIRPPYIAYMQGGLTYEHGKIGLMNAISRLKNSGLLNI